MKPTETLTLIEELIARAETEGVRTGLAGLTDEQRASEVRNRIDVIVPVTWTDGHEHVWTLVDAEHGPDSTYNCDVCGLAAYGDEIPDGQAVND